VTKKPRNPKPTRLSRRIKSARKAAGLSQTDLAAALRVSAPSVCDWENGFIRPTRDRLRPLAKALGISFDELADAYLAP
jgi:transcriptional regulator with XRE-family HTH domain